MAFLGRLTMIPPGNKAYDAAFILYSYPNLLFGGSRCQLRSATAVFCLLSIANHFTLQGLGGRAMSEMSCIERLEFLEPRFI